MKRSTMITAVIAVLILVAFAFHGRVKTALPEASADHLFPVQNLGSVECIDSISMYGDPRYWDDEKNMSVDTDGDGQNDINFAISSSKSEGIDLKGSVKQLDGSWKSMNFWSADLYRLYRNTLMEKVQSRTTRAKDFLTLDVSGLFFLLQEGKYAVKGGSILEDAYVEISTCDIGNDGSIEVLASVVNQHDKNVTAVYEISRNAGDPFLYRGYIRGE